MQFEKRAVEYKKYRKPDERLTRQLIELLDLKKGDKIADIGAGTGNYSLELRNNGFDVYAVEPCRAMRSQCFDSMLKWVSSYADDIDLPNSSVDGAIIINAIHHFENLEKSLEEIYRILDAGTLLILTFDPAVARNNWMFEYWPQLIRYEDTTYLELQSLKNKVNNIFNNKCEEYVFEIPHDFKDIFSAATWKRPQLLLEKDIRKGMSIFSYLDEEDINIGVNWLSDDLSNGNWEKKYCQLLNKDKLDVGCRIIRILKRK